MSDLETALAERLRMAWVRWARTQPTSKPSWLVPWSELDEQSRSADVALAREALAVVAARLPTREEIRATINAHAEYSSWAAFVEHVTEALLRDLRERLGVSQ